MTFPKEHRQKLHSTNPIERLHAEVKRRTNVVGIRSRHHTAILLEQNDEWAVSRRYMTPCFVTRPPWQNVPLEAQRSYITRRDTLRRVPLLAVNRAILFQNAVDDIRERRQLRALRRLASPISRRFRMQQYLGNRLAIDPELARSFPSAQTLTMTRQSHSPIKIHSVHPPPSIRSILTKAIDGPILVRRRNRTNRPLHWGIIAPPFSA